MTLVKQAEELDKVSYHKLFEILKLYQNEVNEISAEKIAKTANPLAVVAATQYHPNMYYQAPKSHKSYASPGKTSSLNISHATTRNKGKEIAKPITPPSDNNLRTSSNTKNKNMDTSQRQRNENQSRQFGNQMTVNVAGTRKTIGNQVLQRSGIHCFNCKEFRHFAKECRKLKGHKEMILLCKQVKKGVPLCGEQTDWLDDTDEELDEQELEAHYMYMAKIQEVLTAYSGPTFDAEPLEKAGQNAKECDDEHAMLANLIANLKLDTYENKKDSKAIKESKHITLS
nr:hypothetical protein [Tanacetum cinerariifolium]